MSMAGASASTLGPGAARLTIEARIAELEKKN
jgi:hypothetical protein